jgi:hypothetical protein
MFTATPASVKRKHGLSRQTSVAETPASNETSRANTPVPVRATAVPFDTRSMSLSSLRPVREGIHPSENEELRMSRSISASVALGTSRQTSAHQQSYELDLSNISKYTVYVEAEDTTVLLKGPNFTVSLLASLPNEIIGVLQETGK